MKMQVCLPSFPVPVLALLRFFLNKRSSSVLHCHSVGTADANLYSEYYELLDCIYFKMPSLNHSQEPSDFCLSGF